MSLIREVARTEALPDYGMSEHVNGFNLGPRYFTEAVPGAPYRNVSPDDPRAQLGWLDVRIDKVKGVLKQLEAWRFGVTQAEAKKQPQHFDDFVVLGKRITIDDCYICLTCFANVLEWNRRSHANWHKRLCSGIGK